MEIRALRAETRLSQRAFGQRLSVSQAVVYAWEAGITPVPDKAAAKARVVAVLERDRVASQKMRQECCKAITDLYEMGERLTAMAHALMTAVTHIPRSKP